MIMFSVFSDTKKTSDKIRKLRNCAGSMFTRTLFAGPEDEPLYILKPGMETVLTFVNKSILFELPRAKTCSNAQWIGVRLRIAANLLNKKVEDATITKEIAIMYHERLTSRVRRILGEIYTEDLPFLDCKRKEIRILTVHHTASVRYIS